VKTVHFKSKAGYKRWVAYGHIHNKFKGGAGERVVIAGRPHRVRHSKRKF